MAIVACCITFELMLFCGTSDTFHTMFAFEFVWEILIKVVIMIGVNKVIYKIPSSFKLGIVMSFCSEFTFSNNIVKSAYIMAYI